MTSVRVPALTVMAMAGLCNITWRRRGYFSGCGAPDTNVPTQCNQTD